MLIDGNETRLSLVNKVMRLTDKDKDGNEDETSNEDT